MILILIVLNLFLEAFVIQYGWNNLLVPGIEILNVIDYATAIGLALVTGLITSSVSYSDLQFLEGASKTERKVVAAKKWMMAVIMQLMVLLLMVVTVLITN